MTIRNTHQDRQLIKAVAEFPVAEEKRAAWIERIKTEGMSEELAVEMHKEIEAPREGEDPVRRTRALTDLTRLVRQWRLGQQTKFFKK